MAEKANKKPKYTAKMKAFVREYMRDLNATQAAIRAGYSKKTARQIGPENLAKPVIKAAIEKEFALRRADYKVLRDRAVQELAAIAVTNSDDFFTWGEDGVTIKESKTLSRSQKAAVQSIKETRVITRSKDGDETERVTVELKLHDKQKALEMLGKHTGAFVDRVELSGPEGGPLAFDVDWGDGGDGDDGETESTDSESQV